MTDTAHRPPNAESSEELRARIPGWGVDLDRADRPSAPRETVPTREVPVHGRTAQRQPEKWPRERSIEHRQLTPVFGTSTPPKGLSGIMRRHAYARYSEARAGHWLLLLTADRVDSLESALRSILTRRPDNHLAETGVLAEFRYHGVASRRGQGRADLQHQLLDPIVVAGPWVLRAALGYRGLRAIQAVLRRRR
jgi:hypothetical protein